MASAGDAGAERRLFKDYFDRAAAARFADQVARGWPAFPRAAFLARACAGLETLEMMDRVRHWSDALRESLPDDVPTALDALVRGLPPPLPDCDGTTDGFLQWPIGQFIADHATGHFEAAMAAMVALTQRFTSEFAVRPFLEREPERTLARLLELTAHPSPHVRRWCSEGTRPRLPWGRRLDALVRDPRPTLPILERLKDDPELYVRRSVANHLNDVAKDHPDLVLEVCRRWSLDASRERAWLVRHALRTLVKRGRPEALAALGYGAPTGLAATLRVAPAEVRIGERLELELELVAPRRGPAALAVLVDYRVHFRKATGRASPKVFKWTALALAPGERRTLVKRHALRVTTVRPLYPGAHAVDAQVNGVVVATVPFALLPPRGRPSR